MASDQGSAADGAWDRLDALETRAVTKLASALQKFARPFADAYESGVIAPVLREKGQPTVDPRVAALFHRRVLNDLRGVWLMLRTGYTTQAASIAASLYECSLAAQCALQGPEQVAAILKDPHEEIPWSVTDMTKMIARKAHPAAGSDFENAWRSHYAQYVWLCQLKHAARQSVIHDTSGTQLPAGYVIMAFPNVHEADLPIKAMVAIIALTSTLDSSEAFVRAFCFSGPLPDHYRFNERMQRARDEGWKAFEPFQHATGAISVRQTRFAQKYPPVSSSATDKETSTSGSL